MAVQLLLGNGRLSTVLIKKGWIALAHLHQLADLEARARNAVNLARCTRAARLGDIKTFDRFDWQHPKKIDRALVEQLGGSDMLYNILSRRHEKPSTIITTHLGCKQWGQIF